MYRLIELDNGLRVVLESIDYVNSVSVGLWVENGSRNENRQNNGISHFIEHMFFKGTHNRNAKELAEIIEDVGGQLNAFTGKEATCFYIKALNTHLELSLDVLSDMLFNSKFESSDIEKEKGVIGEEISMSEDTPEDVLGDLHGVAMWGEDSISFPILGTIETIKSFTREQLIKYVEETYIPINSVISIAGKFDIEETEKLVSKFFGNWKSGSKKATQYNTPIILNNHLYKNKQIEQLHMDLGIVGPRIGDENIYSTLLLNSVFGGGASSILFQKIREERGLCYSIYSYASSFKNTGLISIYAGLNPEYAEDVLNIIKEEIANFVKTGISDERMRKSKEQLKGHYMLGLESTSSRMFSNGKSVLYLGKVNTPEEVIQRVDNISQTTLREVMEQSFAKGIINSAFVGPDIKIDDYKIILENDISLVKANKKILL